VAVALPKEGPKLGKHLEGLAKDLLFVSESDYPYDAFSAPLDPRKPATDDALRKAFKLAPGTEISRRDISEFFRDQQDPTYNDDPAERAKYAALAKAFKSGLKDAEIVYTESDDVVEAKVYLVGRAPDGSITGLSSTRIWT
jgi:hypothetical protein